MKKFLIENNIDKIINTQPLCLSAMIKAMRIVNKKYNKNLILEWTLVDLPTKKAECFLQTIKKLSKKDRSYLKLITIEPLLNGEKDNESFWQKYCNLSEKDVCYKKYVIRKGFKSYLNKKRENKVHEILIRTEHGEEEEYMTKIFQKGPIDYQKDIEGYRFFVNPNDRVFVVLLGSQPCDVATCGYVRSFIDLIKRKGNKDKRYHLFIFSSKFCNTKKNLFKKIADLVEKEEDYPSNFTLIPMSFQDSDSLAAIFHRSDIAITRSGGQTMMEIMGVSNGQKWVHSETKKTRDNVALTYDQLLKGIPGWEAGNADYLVKKHNGNLVTPQILEDLACPYL